MLIESNKDSKASLNSRSVSSYTITASTGAKAPTRPQLSTIVHHTDKMSYLDTNSYDQLPVPPVLMPNALQYQASRYQDSSQTDKDLSFL
jgi:hypothetical protein